MAANNGSALRWWHPFLWVGSGIAGAAAMCGALHLTEHPERVSAALDRLASLPMWAYIVAAAVAWYVPTARLFRRWAMPHSAAKNGADMMFMAHAIRLFVWAISPALAAISIVSVGLVSFPWNWCRE